MMDLIDNLADVISDSFDNVVGAVADAVAPWTPSQVFRRVMNGPGKRSYMPVMSEVTDKYGVPKVKLMPVTVPSGADLPPSLPLQVEVYDLLVRQGRLHGRCIRKQRGESGVAFLTVAAGLGLAAATYLSKN